MTNIYYKQEVTVSSAKGLIFKPLKFLSLILILSIFQFAGQLFAQNSIAPVSSETLELRVANLEQQYDAQLVRVLSNYFNRKKFFVDVNLEAELIDETYLTTQNQIVRERPRENLFMPGLPFLPEESQRQRPGSNLGTETVVNENTIKTLQLNSILVNIYADTSISVDQLELMRFITEVAIKINENRGDQVIISQLAIPDYTERPQPITTATITTPPPTVYDSVIDYIPALILMLLFGLTIIFSRVLNKPAQIVPMREYRENFKAEYEEEREPEFSDTKQDIRKELAEEDARPFSKEELVDAFFNRSAEIASILRFWVGDEAHGSTKAAELVHSIDAQLIRTLRNKLHPEDYDTLSKAVAEIEQVDEERAEVLITEFSLMLQQGAHEAISAERRNKFSLFKFLDHISDQHILTLLETQESLPAAFILQYLPEEKAAHFLNKLDKDIAAKIMLHMASLSNLTNDEQHKISTDLFDKAMDLVEAERNEQFGAEHLYPILERLPVYEQKKYIEELKATGSIVGAILEKQFITIERVPELSDDVIKKAVKSLNTETLLDAILGLEDEIIEKILAVRPKREQRLLRMELEELKGTPIQRTEYAKALLMNSIRKNANP